MSDDILIRFIDKMGTEFLFCIGIIAILAYTVVHAIPIVKEIRIKQIDAKSEEAKNKLEFEREREKQRAEEARREDERDRARTDVIATQNDIFTNVIHSNEAMTIQLSALITALTDSKDRSRILGDTVKDTNNIVTDTNGMVKDIHDIFMKNQTNKS